MSNPQNNVETPMMEPRRPKRDAIQKRIRKLKIGIYTSFILSLVAVALSIVLLTKVQKLQEQMAAIQSELSKIPVEEVKEFYKKVHKLESTVENFRDNLFNYNLRPFLKKNETTVVKSLPPPDLDAAIKNKDVIFYKEHPFDDITDSEAEKADEDDNIGLISNVDSVDEVVAVDEEAPEPSGHDHHHHMTQEEPPKVVKKMCDVDNTDDSDLCEETEGSGGVFIGNIDDSEGVLLTEGSGDVPDGCMQYPRPDCSPGLICYRIDDATKCPVPVCCPES